MRCSSTAAYSARSLAPWAIFVPDGVTRKRKTSAATSLSSADNPSTARRRCARTIDSAPPREASVVTRRRLDPAAALVLPEPLEHELEIGASIRPAPVLLDGNSTPGGAEVDLTRGGLVEHRFDQLGLDLDRLARQLVVALDGLQDGVSGRTPVEMIQPKVVREQIWDPSLEAVELGERVIAQRQQDADPEPRACDQLGQIDGKAALPLVVEEILLRLVEDQQQVACEPLGPATECVGERFALPFVEESRAELGGQLLAHRRPQAAHRILAPCVEDHHCELRVAALFDVPPRLTAQAVSDARSQHRVFPTPLGP